MEDKLIIKKSRKKEFKSLVIYIVLLIISGLGIYNSYQKLRINESYEIYLIVFILSALLFALSVIYVSTMLKEIIKYSKKTVVEIDMRGFTDNSPFFPAGRILWKDVKRVYTVPVKKDKYVYIEIKDPEKFWQKITPLKRKILKLDFKFGITPVRVNCTFSEKDKDYVFKEMLASYVYWKEKTDYII